MTNRALIAVPIELASDIPALSRTQGPNCRPRHALSSSFICWLFLLGEKKGDGAWSNSTQPCNQVATSCSNARQKLPGCSLRISGRGTSCFHPDSESNFD